MTYNEAQFARWDAALDAGGDAARQAKGEICAAAWKLSEASTRAKLRERPWVRRWEETDDLGSELRLRLLRMLDSGFRPKCQRHLVNLGAQVVHRLLIDFTRKHMGATGWGANHVSDAGQGLDDSSLPSPLGKAPAADDEAGPVPLADMSAFHEWVQALPGPELELFRLRYYLGMPHREIANLMGLEVATVEKRWRRLWRRALEYMADRISEN